MPRRKAGINWAIFRIVAKLMLHLVGERGVFVFCDMPRDKTVITLAGQSVIEGKRPRNSLLELAVLRFLLLPTGPGGDAVSAIAGQLLINKITVPQQKCAENPTVV